VSDLHRPMRRSRPRACGPWSKASAAAPP
jgi:hypothetical protein